MSRLRIPAILAATATAVAGVVLSCALVTSASARLDAVAIALAVGTYALVAAVIVVARPGHRIGRLMLVGALGWGIGEGALAWGVSTLDGDTTSAAAALVATLGTASRAAGWLILVLAVPLVFPDGRPASSGRVVPGLTASAIAGFVAATLLSPTPLDTRLEDVTSPTGLPDSWQPLADVLAIGSLALAAVSLAAVLWGLRVKWRRGDPLVRQQLFWFGAAFTPALLLLPLIPTSLVAPWMFAAVTLPVAVALGVALLQNRLYDVQLAISRTLTWGGLWVVLAGAYALVVGGVGALLRGQQTAWLPWVAAGVVAVAFAPVREALQRAANRVVYGGWSSPSDVLAQTGRRLADAADVPGLLQAMTDELVQGLGLEFAEIVDGSGRSLARAGSGGVHEQIELTAYGRGVGQLRWRGRALREGEQELLADLARQIGGLVHSARLVDEVRQAQERLVLAREQERRRLRRDLHDGLGPSLAGLGLQVDRITNRLAPGADDVAEDLATLRRGLAGTVSDVRRLVEGLRPPSIDELGLFEAVAALSRDLVGRAGLDLRLDLPMDHPVLPAAVEVAAYRVAQEALTNVVRHSGARTCSVSARLSADGLVLRVTDDGHGGARATDEGIGLVSMAERAGEIGGELVVSNGSDSGTTVRLLLPLRNGIAT